jgi:glycosyltransferase involved in cell wall biosynthesis
MIPANRQTVCAIIPAFGEAQYIGEVVRGVFEHVDRVIVVDDHSPDTTADVAEQTGAEVIRHDANLGKGAAIKTALNHITDSFGFYLFLDGDGQHDPAEIPKFLATATRTQAHLILGNRMNDVTTMPAIRRWTNRFMSWQISRLCGRTIPDSQCGYRIVRSELVPLLLESCDGFAFETENLLMAAQDGFQIEFVPIRTIYRDQRSKIKPLRDGQRYLRIMARYRVTNSRSRSVLPSRVNLAGSSSGSIRRPGEFFL